MSEQIFSFKPSSVSEKKCETLPEYYIIMTMYHPAVRNTKTPEPDVVLNMEVKIKEVATLTNDDTAVAAAPSSRHNLHTLSASQ